MAKRGPKRNPDSHLQLQMAAFFGQDASKYSTVWRTWPATYKKIVQHMFQNKLSIVRTAELKRLRKLEEKLKKALED